MLITLDNANYLDSVNVIDSSSKANQTSSNASLILPSSIFTEGGGLQDDTPVRVAYAVFSKDILFQSSEEYGDILADGNRSVGTPIVSASLINGSGQVMEIKNLTIMPVIIEFSKPWVSQCYTYANEQLDLVCFYFQSLRANKTSSVCVYWDNGQGMRGERVTNSLYIAQ